MKKVLILLLLILFPTIVFADDALLKDNPNAKTNCYNAESSNENISQATNGTYYECVAIICNNGKNQELIKKDFVKNLTCSNSNSSPKYTLEKTSERTDLKAESACNNDNTITDSETGAYAFIIRKYTYNCEINSTSKVSTQSPETGVNNYFLVLGGLIIFLSLVLSIINKKNIFKKI